MTLRESSFLARWAFPFSRPPQTNLCALFWRTVLLTPLILGVSGLVVALVVVEFITDMGAVWTFLIAVGIIVGGIAAIAGLVTLGDWLKEIAERARDEETYGALTSVPSSVRAVFRLKRRLCPVIRMVRAR